MFSIADDKFHVRNIQNEMSFSNTFKINQYHRRRQNPPCMDTRMDKQKRTKNRSRRNINNCETLH